MVMYDGPQTEIFQIFSFGVNLRSSEWSVFFLFILSCLFFSIYLFIYLFWDTGVWSQGLILAKQEQCPSPSFALLIFEEGLMLFAWGWPHYILLAMPPTKLGLQKAHFLQPFSWNVKIQTSTRLSRQAILRGFIWIRSHDSENSDSLIDIACFFLLLVTIFPKSDSEACGNQHTSELISPDCKHL
jgi:hypothetical protein